MGRAKAVLAALIEPVWLGSALARAAALDDEKRGRIEPLGVAASRRHDAAGMLHDDTLDIAALELEREAFEYAARALAIQRGEEESEPLAYVRGRDLSDVEPAFSGELDSLDPARARSARIALERVVTLLLRELEWRTPETIRRLRTNRLILLLVLLVLAASLAIRAYNVTSNVARYKAAESSGLAGDSANIAALTDGNRKEPLFIRSSSSPWATLDLLGRFRLARVAVYSGVASPADMFPCVLELSDDGERWIPVAERKEPLHEREAWRVELGGRAARWLRVRHAGPGTLALSEIEAYAER